MIYCYCVVLFLFVLSYELIVCTVPLPPDVDTIAVDKYINKPVRIRLWQLINEIRTELAVQEGNKLGTLGPF